MLHDRKSALPSLAWLLGYVEEHFAELPCNELLDGDQKYTFGEIVAKIREISNLMLASGIGADEKVAILSQNMPNWTVAFFAAVGFGRVSVPILAESSSLEVSNILSHSETSVLFVSKAKLPLITEEVKEGLNMIILLDNFEVLKNVPKEGPAELREPVSSDVAGLFYTSGTTGKSKGVMLSHGNLCQNIIAACYVFDGWAGCRWLSILPMAHTYEMAFSLLLPFYLGGTVFYLSKPPTVSVLTRALAQVKPHVVCSVPLILEKIYRSSVRKTIDSKAVLRLMEKTCKNLLYRIIGKKLIKFFGGEIVFVGIGGSKVDYVVEDFLSRAKFPYAIGYGLTETAPLISAKPVGKGTVGSIGWPAQNVEVRLGNIDPETHQGEIQCKGPNVMLGYYKDEERTKSVFTEDGWLRTGDLASIDKKGCYSIRGRIGTMIVGASGENIYPEEIESVINEVGQVSESVVVKRGEKLVALVKLEEQVSQAQAFLEEKAREIMKFVNERTRKSNNINQVEFVKENFIKTATMKIRRFL